MSRNPRLVGALLLLVVASVFAVPGVQLASGPTERLTNGNFESGFHSTPAGFVGNGWNWFHSGGQSHYGFYDDTWAPVVYDGAHSQLIEINTFDLGAADADRYSGIYQTVAVVPGQVYELSVHGMLRALEDDPDRSNYSYRVELGVDFGGGTDWTAVTNWVEIPWDTVHPRLAPGAMDAFYASITSGGPRMTVFLRAWKKWGTLNRELDLNLDGLSLVGAMPADVDGYVPPGAGGVSVNFAVPTYPVAGWSYTIHVDSSNDVGVTSLSLYDNGSLIGSVGYDVGPLSLSHDFAWTPATAGNHKLKAVAIDSVGAKAVKKVKVKVGHKGQFLTNASFESGFSSWPVGQVGYGWGAFTNGGAASFGFYDETWTPVVYDGSHSQLIEINSMGRAASDPDRYAGIYQTVAGLTPGATYKLSMYGMLRVREGDTDREGYNYRVQWGYLPYASADWTAVTNWVEVPWDTVHARLSPGAMDHHVTSFQAPSGTITVFVRAWKKWGTVNRELDVNLDRISLRGYQ